MACAANPAYLGKPFARKQAVPIRPFTPARSVFRRRSVLGLAAAAVLAATTGCDDSSTEPGSRKTSLQVSAAVGGGEAGRSIALGAHYLRTGGQEVAISVDPASIAVSNAATVTGTISADVRSCHADSNREIAAGFSTACRVYVVARLLSANGVELSEDQSSIVVMPNDAGPLTVDAFTLPSGALVPADATVDFTMVESGQIPAAMTIAITSSTTVPPGVLSASIEYISGTGWLTATIPSGQSAVTLAPSTTTPAPGSYEAIVRVTSTSLFTPTQIHVAYVVPQPPKTVTITGAGNGTGAVLLTPNGTTCTTTAGQLSGLCTLPAPHGSTVTLTAAPAVGSGFTGWSGACQGRAECTVVMGQDRAVTATFTILKRALTVDAAGTGSGGITSSPSGISCTATGGAKSGTCVAEFDHPTQVTLTAAPTSATSTFTGWSGACTGTGACVVTMTDARNVTATFALIPRQLSVSVGPGAGTVTSTLAGIACESTTGFTTVTCSAPFAHGTVVTLTAAPAANMTFAGWSGAGCTGTGACTVTMDQARTVTANITPPLHTLTITSSGNGIASVQFFVPSGSSCQVGQGSVCSREIPAGIEAEIYVGSESSFGSLSVSGCDRFYSGALAQGCFVRMNGPRTVNVAVSRPSTSVTVLGSGTGAGRVTDGYIDCRIAAGVVSGVCTSNFYGRNEAVVTATPEPGSTFTGWTNCSVSSGSTCRIGILDSRTVTATFALIQQQLTVAIGGGGTGTVTSSPAGIACASASGSCTASFPHGISVVLTANPATGTTFTGWGGACTGTGTCTVVMDGTRSVTAGFTAPLYRLTITHSGNTGGFMTFVPEQPGCLAPCSRDFPAGTVVQITASKSGVGGSVVLSGDCSAGGAGLSATCSVTMDGPKTVNANFVSPIPLMSSPSPGPFADAGRVKPMDW